MKVRIIEKELSLEELQNFVKELLDLINGCEVILLKGNLASGKTTLVKEIAKALHVNKSVTSPTFSIQNVYDNKIYHYDIYQKGIESFLAEGLLEELEKEGLHIIEWADEKLEKILDGYMIDYTEIKIEEKEDKRVYKVNRCIH